MSRDHEALIADARSMLRIHTAVVAGIVEAVRKQTGVDLSPEVSMSAPKPPAAGPVGPSVDWKPGRFLRYLATLQRAADEMGLERFADRDDEFTIRDLAELTREIDLQAGVNGLYIFDEADGIAEGPTS